MHRLGAGLAVALVGISVATGASRAQEEPDGGTVVINVDGTDEVDDASGTSVARISTAAGRAVENAADGSGNRNGEEQAVADAGVPASAATAGDAAATNDETGQTAVAGDAAAVDEDGAASAAQPEAAPAPSAARAEIPAAPSSLPRTGVGFTAESPQGPFAPILLGVVGMAALVLGGRLRRAR